MIDYFDMVSAFTADFLNVFVVEPADDSAEIVRLDGYVTDGIEEAPQVFGYTQMLHAYANGRVCDADFQDFLNLLSPEHLQEYFKGENNKLEFLYRVVHDGAIHYYIAQYNKVKSTKKSYKGRAEETAGRTQSEETLRLVAGFRNADVLVSMMKSIEGRFPESMLKYEMEYGK